MKGAARFVVIVVVIAACGSSPQTPDAPPGTADARKTADANPLAPDAAPLPASDTFDGTSLDPSWTVLDPSKVTVAVGGGQLTLTPAANALWYNAGTGGLVYKLVDGDFTATATVHAHKASNPSAPPDQMIELGGVMARAPGSTQDYVFVVVGFGEQGHTAVEHKTTANNASTFAEVPFAADAELRLCRVGTTITLYRRAVGALTWTQDFSIDRPDLPATLQVGPNAYDGDAAPDVAVSFDDFVFASAAGGCTS